MRHAAVCLVVLMSVAAAACQPARPGEVPGLTKAALPPATGAAPAGAPPAFLALMAPSVAPGDDFFAYANGSWLATAEIPSDRRTWGTGPELAELTDKRNAELIASAGAIPSPEAQKVAAFYKAFTDEAGIEARGLA